MTNGLSKQQREAIAAVQHEIWPHWMRYQWQCGRLQDDGSFVIPADKVDRWHRQMQTPYSQLSNLEQESDRHQADKVIAALLAQQTTG